MLRLFGVKVRLIVLNLISLFDMSVKEPSKAVGVFMRIIYDWTLHFSDRI